MVALVNNNLTKKMKNNKIFKVLQILSGCCILNRLIFNIKTSAKKFLAFNRLIFSNIVKACQVLSGGFKILTKSVTAAFHSSLFPLHIKNFNICPFRTKLKEWTKVKM
jgi:hypothetical protein